MGGNAFPTASRLTAKQYEDLTKRIFSVLDQRKEIDVLIPLSYRFKESFGDVDMIMESREVADEIIKSFGDSVLDKIYNPCGYNLLIVYDGINVQVDLNLVGKGNLDSAFWYFSYNDLGNLIGRIAHRQGLKFGHDGLWYTYRDPENETRVLGEFLLTKDMMEAVEYLGFDADKYAAGFDSLEEMFLWVVESTYFEPSAYPLEHRNHKARTRDSKRKNYNAFLTWLDERGYDMTWVPSDKEAWLDDHKAAFPRLSMQMREADQKAAEAKAWKARFGGERVMELLPLTGKTLGDFMRVVRERFPMTEENLTMPFETSDAELVLLYLKEKA